MTTAAAATDAVPQHDLASAEKKRAAMRWAREYINENGKRGAGAAVARKFGMSPRWGQGIASEAEASAASARGPADRHLTSTADRHLTGTADRQSTGTVAEAAAQTDMPRPARVSFGTPGSALASTSAPRSAPLAIGTTGSAPRTGSASAEPAPAAEPTGTTSAHADEALSAVSAQPPAPNAAPASASWRRLALRQIVPLLPLLLIGSGAFVSIWGGWVGLGKLTGFGEIELLPGVPASRFNTAITLPLGMEAYAAYALRVWLAPPPNLSPGARRFARWSAIGALILGAAGQIAYHLMVAAGITAAPWQITAFVACLPVAVLGFGAALAHLMRHPERGRS